jgi:hypothetical protein
MTAHALALLETLALVATVIATLAAALHGLGFVAGVGAR